jgi:enoyl-CoA hydratase
LVSLEGYQGFSIAVDGYVAEVTFNRPELLNRFDAMLHSEFTRALAVLRRRTDLRAVILASTGKVFSAGGDFEYMLEIHENLATRLDALDEGRLLFETLIDLPMPVIAALHGDAIGLGASVVLACDVVVAARSAGLADPHVAVGLVAGDGGCVAWPLAAGMLRAKRYLLTGERIGAEAGHAMGLVTDLVDEPADVLPAARALAAKIAGLPPVAVQGTKRALNHLVQARAAEVLKLSFALEGHSVASEDLVEAIAAFRERREPKYQGR